MSAKPPKHRPFRVLRARKPASAPERSRVLAEPPATELSFEEAAARAGVIPLPRVAPRIPPPKKATSSAVPTRAAPSFTLEHDEDWLSGYRTELGTRVLRNLRGTPGATLDLHGLTAAAARRRLATFVQDERARGITLVLVIVGKGRHSRDGHAILRSEIGDWLSSPPSAEHVNGFETAPSRLGGHGCVLVLLATTRTRSR